MKKFLALILALVMSLSLVACGGSKTEEKPADTKEPAQSTENKDAAPEFEKMTWKFACSANDQSNWVGAAKVFAQIVGEKTGGAITVEYYPQDQLTAGNQTEGIQAMLDGTTELSMHSNLIWAAFDSRFSVVSLPFLFANTDEADEKLNGEGGKVLQGIMEESGAHLLGIAENGFRHITNTVRPIEKVEDMQGIKFRVAGNKLLNKAYTLWGTNWSNANWSEVFTGLQTGTYEGQENPLPTADSASMAEVNKYMTYWTGVYDCLYFCMNGELYDSLSPELQAIVDEAGAEACDWQRAQNRSEDEGIIAKWEAAGIQVTRLSEEAAAGFRAAVEPMYTDPEVVDMLSQELIDAFTK